MHSINNGERKHYRVYRHKKQEASTRSCFKLKKNYTLYGLIGLAFVKGLFLGYLFRNRR